jgi:capsular polysaccharide transport system permease protein
VLKDAKSEGGPAGSAAGAKKPGAASPPPRPAPPPGAKPAGASGPQPAPPPPAMHPVRDPAGAARMKRRHRWLLLSFFLLVLLPSAGSAVYLYAVAKDQYASRVGFSVRREEVNSAIEILGGITSLSGSSTRDTDVLFEYIGSQPMVRRIDERLDLRAIYTRPGDPVFTLAPGATIEDLTAYWSRMVKVFYDSASGLIEIRVQAFSPEDAQRVAQAVFEESSAMINNLSNVAREDATRYAKEELDRAIERLVQARQALTEFRARTQIVDPQADIQGRMSLLATLEGQLVEARIDLDILRETTRENDPRVQQAERRVAVIEDRIAAERARFGMADGSAPGTEGDGAYASLVADYERLSVDQQFAEQAYLSALAGYDAALAEAQRQSRYLAAYVEPTRAETAEYPQRPVILTLITVFSLVGWSILALVYYSIRDRR